MNKRLDQDLTRQAQELTRKIEETPLAGSESPADGVLLFISVDIANSARIKYSNNNWPEDLRNIIQYLIEDAGRLSSDDIIISVWRILGDEVIFVVPISSVQQIVLILEHFRIMAKDKRIISELLKKRLNLALQIVIWITSIKPDNDRFTYTQIAEYTPTSENSIVTDYIGIDMDLGFRLREHKSSDYILISPEIAFLLNQHLKEMKDKFIVHGKFIPREFENGTPFNNLLYPQIIYYDETYEDEPIQKSAIKTSGNEDNKFEPFHESEEVKKYFEHPINTERMGHILDSLKKEKNLDHCESNLPGTLQLHQVVVCYDKENNRILAFKRNSVANSSDIYDFGCSKAVNYKSFTDSLMDYYSKELNVPIKLLIDDQRDEQQPRPIAVYELNKNNRLKKGIIFVGLIQEEFKLENFRPNMDYSEAAWVTPENLDEFSKQSLIKDFKNTCTYIFDRFGGLSDDTR